MKLILLLIAATLVQGCIPISFDARVPYRRMALLVNNEAGQPISRAHIAVKTRALTTPKEGLPATDNGTINLLSPGYLYGGGVFLVFGFIPIPPISPKPPKEQYLVMADGYRSVQYDSASFFIEPHKTAQEMIRFRDYSNTVQVLLYERTVMLKEK